VARIVLVVPCFNEGKRLDARAFGTFELPGHFVDFRFVDDGSTDDTASVLEGVRAARGGVVVQRLEKNSGKAEAVRQGFLAALAEDRPDYVGFWDADLAAPLSELAPFVALLESRRDVDVLYGSRVMLMGRSIDRVASRHYLGRAAATLVSMTLALPIYDTQCGHKLFRATDLLGRVFAEPFLTRWVFDVEILARLLALDPLGRDHAASTIYELPLTKWVDVRGSKVKPGDFVRSLADLVTIRRHYRAATRSSGRREK
jgi:glycosyltransferase involved in cell wall biosynthesis